MNVYFYHTQDIQMILRRLAVGEFPAHFLYGATKLGRYGIGVVWHKSRLGLPRWRMMLRNAWQVLSCREKYDAVYATNYRGLEIVVFLRALRLFRKPIVVWHHQPIVRSASPFRELLGRLFYRGMDHMFFFSQQLIDTSLKQTRKAWAERMHLGHWGMCCEEGEPPASAPFPLFVSSGKEMRDIPTLVEAFNATGERLDVYIARRCGDMDYERILSALEIRDNISVHYPDALAPWEISRKVRQAGCVVICCQPTNYTVGLTTLVEALALGKPVICSRNPQIPIDVDKEGCGIGVDYGDVEGWKRAIAYIAAHPDEARRMGERGKNLARTAYNDEICAKEVAEVLLSNFDFGRVFPD